MRGKGFGFALVLVVAGYALAGFLPGAAMAAQDTIKIGAVLPLSKAAFARRARNRGGGCSWPWRRSTRPEAFSGRRSS